MVAPYKVWTEDEIKNRNVVAAGDYPFKIISTVKTRTKQKLDDHGQPKQTYEMWELEFEYHDQNGVVKKMKDWIVFCEGMDWKLRHLANTTGQLELYNAQELDICHLLGRLGVFTLGVKEYEKDGEKLKQNFIKDYVKKAVDIQKDDNFVDSDIPL